MRRHLLLLAEGLAPDVEQVAFIPDDPRLAEELAALGVKSSVVPFPGDGGFGTGLPDLARALRRGFAREDVDLLHLHGYRAGVAGALAAGDRRAVVTVHNLPPSGLALAAFPLARSLIVSRARRLIFVSEAIRSAWGIGSPQASVVYNALDPRFETGFGPRPEPTWAAGYFGRLSHEKGVDLFIEALAEVPRQSMGCRYLISGQGPREAALRDLARELGLAESIDFTGSTGDVPDLMRRTSIVAIPSRREGFSLVAIEALALSTPVIAARVGGLPEAVGEFGVLFERGDVAALARLLNGAASGDTGSGVSAAQGSPAFDGEAASRWVRETFSIQRMIEGTKAVYAEALES
jgi:glycosyltransferase involved in cell wall biosynthesis